MNFIYIHDNEANEGRNLGEQRGKWENTTRMNINEFKGQSVKKIIIVRDGKKRGEEKGKKMGKRIIKMYSSRRKTRIKENKIKIIKKIKI